MYKRLTIVSVIIVSAMFGLTWLGYHSILIRAQGMQGTRLGEFAEVAEQIRQDVKRKLDEFMQTEQSRPYTDYQYYYVPENVAPNQQRVQLLRSPLGSSIENNLAYGNFQIESDGRIVTPYFQTDKAIEDTKLSRQTNIHISNIKQNLLPVLNGSAGVLKLDFLAEDIAAKPSQSPAIVTNKKEVPISIKSKTARGKEYSIKSLENKFQQDQIVTQKRQFVTDNFAQNTDFKKSQFDVSGIKVVGKSESELLEGNLVKKPARRI